MLYLVAPNQRVVESLHQELESQKRTALVRCVVPPLPGLSWGKLLVQILVLVMVPSLSRLSLVLTNSQILTSYVLGLGS